VCGDGRPARPGGATLRNGSYHHTLCAILSPAKDLCIFLMPQSADHIQQQGKRNAQDDGRGQGKVEGSSLATIKNIAGQTSEGQTGAPQDQKESSQ